MTVAELDARKAARAVRADRWLTAKRLAILKSMGPAWWTVRMVKGGRKAPCVRCGFPYRSRTTDACGWCHCEHPDGRAA